MGSLAKDYYLLAKPGIVRGNALAAIGGFLLGAQGRMNWALFAAMLLGLSAIIASACVANNVLDRGIDKRMHRTRKRALVTGTIHARAALTYALLLGTSGIAVLLTGTNGLALATALVGFVFYVFVYGLAKRYSVHGTVIGGIAGAMPPVVGYAAATGRIDTAAWLLLAVLTFWQMPHFYAIALYRKNDYAAANLPVLPIVKGDAATKRQMIWYIIGFAASCVALTVAGYTGISYTVVMIGVSLYWLLVALRGYHTPHTAQWARTVFGVSLVSLLAFCIMISVDAWIP